MSTDKINPSLLDIARSATTNLESNRTILFPFEVFAFNGAVPSGNFVDIWSYGPIEATYPWPTTNEKFRIKSGGNASDTVDGIGARTVQITYLDSAGAPKVEILNTAGASASNLSAVIGRRFLKAEVMDVGVEGGGNIGDVLFENEVTGQIVGFIGAGMSQTEMSHFTVPLGFTGYLGEVEQDIAIGASKDASIRFWHKKNAYNTSAPYGAKKIIRRWPAIQGEGGIKYNYLKKFPQLTDLWAEAKGNAGPTEINFEYDMLLVKNN